MHAAHRQFLCALLVTSSVGLARGSEAPPSQEVAAPPLSPSAEAEATPVAPPPVDLGGPLEAGERDTLLRLAWQTLRGHLTEHPIQDRDLEAYNLTPRLAAARGCFITLRKSGAVRGTQGEIEASRPLYQQVIVFTRRASTRDARFVPLTDRDLAATLIEISVIGARAAVPGPGEISVDRQGIFLEKWGRRALFLPGQAAEKGWGAERALEELCRQAKLPAGSWKVGAKIEVFSVETITGAEPAPLPEAGVPPPGPSPAADAAP